MAKTKGLPASLWDPDTLRKIACERVNLYAKSQISMSLIRQGNMAVEVNRAIDGMAIALTMKLYPMGWTKRLHIELPATWFDHLRLAHPWISRVLFWLKVPNVYVEDHVVNEIFPGIAMPDRYGTCYFYDMKEYTTGVFKGFGLPGKVDVEVSPKENKDA